MNGLYNKITETAAFLSSRINAHPTVGIILGSGLGGLADVLDLEKSFSYSEVPNFPSSSVVGHAGKLLFGRLGGKQVMLMAGRFHYYEGYNMQQVTFPVRIMKALGVETLFVSNAAGGMNKNYNVGNIAIITDHINLFPEHPLRGPNDDRLGTRFPDMSEPYSKSLINVALQLALTNNIHVNTGVYAGLSGPTFETRAEYGWLQSIGADLVGMSTVPEVIVAIHGGMRCFGASIVTDLGIREELNVITHEEVLEAANIAAPKLGKLIELTIQNM